MGGWVHNLVVNNVHWSVEVLDKLLGLLPAQTWAQILAEGLNVLQVLPPFIFNLSRDKRQVTTV